MNPPNLNNPKISIWLFLDRNDWPSEYVRFLERQGFAAKLFQKPSECLARVKRGMGDCDVVVIHKDLGVHVPDELNLKISSDQVVQRIHEVAPHVRVGIVSGEYPDGGKHVLAIGADFYLSPQH